MKKSNVKWGPLPLLLLPALLATACGEVPTEPISQSPDGTQTPGPTETPPGEGTPTATGSTQGQDTPTATADDTHAPTDGTAALTPSENETEDPNTTPDETPDGTPDHTPDGTPGDTPDLTPDGTPAGTPDDTPVDTTQTPQGETPNGTPGETPVETPAGTPGDTPAGTPGDTPAATPSSGQGTAAPTLDPGTATPTTDPGNPTPTPVDITPTASSTETPGDLTLPETPTDGPTATPSATFGESPTPTSSLPAETPTAAPITPTLPLPTPGPAESAAQGDVIISEFMAAPRRAADGSGEWVELTNISEKTIDLDGWWLTLSWGQGNSDTLQIESEDGTYLLPPRHRVVIGNNANYFENGNIPVQLVVPELTLDDGGFSLGLRQGAQVIDAIAFDESFTALEGHSLSLSRDAESADANNDGANWCASFHPIEDSTDYGSPGLRGEVCGADADGDGHPLPHDCDDENAQVNGLRAEIPANQIDDDCDLAVDEALAYAPGALLINEIMFDPEIPTDENAEWVEFYNPGPKALDLEGWTVGNGRNTHIIYRSLVVEAEAYVVLGVSDNFNGNGGVGVDYVLPGLPLQNDVDAIRLYTDNALIDSVFYDETWPQNEGFSLSLDPDGLDVSLNDDRGHWCVAQSYITEDSPNKGSPGEGNPICGVDNDNDGYSPPDDCDDADAGINPDETEIPGNGVDENCDGKDFIDVDQDGFSSAEDCDDNDPSINPDAEEIPDNGIDENCDELDCIDGDEDGYCPPEDCDDIDPQINPGESEVLGNDTDENCDGEAEPLPDSVAFITEICYRGTNDIQPHLSEWLEIHNPGDLPLNVGGWMISSESGTFEIDDGQVIAAGGYLLLGGSTNTNQNGNIPVDIAYGDAIVLNNGSDTLTLADDDGEEIDIVAYQTTDPWPPITERSMSIQLDPDAYNHALNDDGANWCLSNNVYNATTTGTPSADNLDCFFRTRMGQFD